ncbi:tail fiber domain-containing protein [Limnoraphis robusta CCNP1324]|uniref:tail fiber domain-containing protein n=1 Tax=Limnoraphis robusta TaxID=1118279 RepID=UPI002B21B7E1|nr:tail fiber domain-containing protein [Limnoraphis robusta]MEA5544537.1 tail fiber domain-containing protein [Limnoraphis robusta CCNP1324]
MGRFALSLSIVLACLATPAVAQAPFTYQGRLGQSGQPVTTPVDLRFRLFNNATGGNQIGSENLRTLVPGPGGVFTVSLDFGAAFGPTARHLEIAVRPAWNGQGAEPGFTTLSPRSVVMPTPVAHYALSAPVQPADWNQLLNVPAGFADAVDNDTTYTAGMGVRLLGSIFSLDLGFADTRYLNEGDAAGGDVSGAFSALSVNALRGRPVSAGSPTIGQILTWNGSAWAPASPSAGTVYSAGSGLSLSGNTFSLQNTHTSLNLVTGGAATATSAGRIGINATPSDTLHINAPAGEDALRVQVDGNTSLRVYANGGVSLGANNINTAADAVYVSGKIGIGTPTPDYPLEIASEFGTGLRIESTTSDKAASLSANNLGFAEDGRVYGFTGLELRSNLGLEVTANTDMYIGGTILPLITMDANAITLDTWELRLEATDFVRIDSLTTIIDQDLTVLQSAFKPGGGNWSVLSDARMKTNIDTLHGAMHTVSMLHPVTFKYRDPSHPLYVPGTLRGFVAQEVAGVIPEWVTPVKDPHAPDGDETLGLTMVGYEALMVAAFQELRAEKDAQIEALQRENEQLRDRLDRIERLLGQP